MAIDIYKAPVTYSVPTITPIRIAGSKDPPFRIINLETDVTVWLSNNAGLKSGQGTPLNPGTSLLWVTPTELFAIAENRSASIILTTEIEDWQPDPAAIATAIVNSGVIVIDNPVQLFNTSLSAGNGRSTGFIDISRYQSVSIELAETVASGGANDSALIEFSNDGTNVSMSKTVETFDVSPAIGSTWRAAIPCHGKYIRIRSNLTNTNYSLRLFGSYRAKQHIEQSMIDYNGGVTTDFYNDFISSFPAGNGVIVTFGPWYGEIEVSGSFIIAPPITAGNLVNTVVRRNTSTGVFNHSIMRLPITQPMANLSPNLWNWSGRFAADGSVYQFQFTNNHTAALSSWAARIAPVSGYGAVA